MISLRQPSRIGLHGKRFQFACGLEVHHFARICVRTYTAVIVLPASHLADVWVCDMGGNALPSKVEALATSIRSRADTVVNMGQWLGVFDWVVWAASRLVALQFLFGETLIDVGAVFAPKLVPHVSDGAPASICTAICCMSTARGLLPAATSDDLFPRMNHYVLAIPLPSRASSSPVADSTWRASAGPVGSASAAHSLRAVCQRAGYAVIETVTDGNCGPHTMAKFERRDETPLVFRLIRKELAAYMREHADNIFLQEAFVSCQEFAPPPGDTQGPMIGMAAVSSSADGGMGPRAAMDVSASACTSSASIAASVVDAVRGGLADAHDHVKLDLPPVPPPASPPPAVDSCENGVHVASPSGTVSAIDREGSPDDTLSEPIGTSHGVPMSPVGCSEHQPGPSVMACSFASWLTSVDDDKLGVICRDYATFKVAEAEWLRQCPRALEAHKKVPKTLQRSSTLLRQRLATGQAYWRWRRGEEGRVSKASLRDFHRIMNETPDVVVSKKHKVHLARCAKLASMMENGHNVADHGRGRGVRRSSRKVPSAGLRKRRGMQGGRFKCPVLREQLWEWFVCIRSSVQCRIPPKFVLRKAQDMANELVKEMRRVRRFIPMPAINKAWLLRWQQDYGVSFRKPNKRYKCTYQTLGRRVMSTWKNVYKVRALAIQLLGHDLPLYGLDQTPVFMNEGGSRKSGTLSIVGAPEVVLKENHAATRERVSVLTSVSSDKASCLQPKRLPLEVLFRGKTKRILKGIRVPDTVNMTVTFQEKGSYRVENMLSFLDRWLDKWDDARMASADWRILLLDSYSAHFDESIQRLCWDRGYILLFHYGHTTGVTQVNDTDLHGPFKRIYLDFEAQDFFDRQLMDPGDISRSRSEVSLLHVFVRSIC